MKKRMINGITDSNICRRIAWLYLSFFLILVPATVVSYLLLPEGILRGRHPVISALELSPSLHVSTLQIFGYNLIPTFLVIGANFIGRQSRLSQESYIPLGYLAFWGITATVAVYLGTWSQEVVTPAPHLHVRFLRLLDIVHHAGLLELSAYLLAAATSFKFTLLYTDGRREVARRRWREVALTRLEKALLALAFALLLCGAFVESYGIARVST